jgi:hypothetical protein
MRPSSVPAPPDTVPRVTPEVAAVSTVPVPPETVPRVTPDVGDASTETSRSRASVARDARVARLGAEFLGLVSRVKSSVGSSSTSSTSSLSNTMASRLLAASSDQGMPIRSIPVTAVPARPLTAKVISVGIVPTSCARRRSGTSLVHLTFTVEPVCESAVSDG